ncbi:unnamed protein product [Durusdinium trenchii]|uniref:EF-hand domain-containing protein n=1 Tax=Durusdinium trenchii TaxID=1381693 RepID=A0ABP0JCI7_9DINO
MRTSVVSFGYGSSGASQTSHPDAEPHVLLGRKIDILHEFVEKSFRRQAKLLRMEVRRNLRAAREPDQNEVPIDLDFELQTDFNFEEVEADKKAAETESVSVPFASKEDQFQTPPSSPPASPRHQPSNGPSRPSMRSHQSRPSTVGQHRSSLGSAFTTFTGTSGRRSLLSSVGASWRSGSRLRLSGASELTSSTIQTGHKTLHSVGTEGTARSHRSLWSLHTNRSNRSNTSNQTSNRSADRSWETGQSSPSSPDSFLKEHYDQHLATAQIQAMWMTRRRFFSDTSSNKERGWQSFAEEMIDSAMFSYILTPLILLHVILMGVEVDVYIASGPLGMPSWISIVNLILVSLFMCELLLKFAALGCRKFWCGTDWAWNTFDACVISLSVADVALDLLFTASVQAGQVRVFRMVRIFRYLRSIRVVRLFRYISALQVLILSIIGTMSSLAWTLALLLLIIYSFAVVLTELVVEHCSTLIPGNSTESSSVGGPLAGCSAQLTDHWANVAESMMTLFMTISQGLNWEELVTPLREFSIVPVALLLLYVVIAIFAILNVVTGVFCNTAIDSAGADKDVRTLKQIQARSQQVELLKQVFSEIDFEKVNEISLEDIKRCLGNDDLADFLESMGISTDDVWTLFMLLDSDHTGLLDLDEFVSGCMQLHGPAKSIQAQRKDVFSHLPTVPGLATHDLMIGSDLRCYRLPK